MLFRSNESTAGGPPLTKQLPETNVTRKHNAHFLQRSLPELHGSLSKRSTHESSNRKSHGFSGFK